MILETIDYAIVEAGKRGWAVQSIDIGVGLYPQFRDELMLRAVITREAANKTIAYKGIPIYLRGTPYMLDVNISYEHQNSQS